MPDIQVYPDSGTLAHAAAGYFSTLAADCITRKGVFSVVLSGGSTPRAVYRLLAGAEYSGKVDWGHVYVFWGDERCVPPGHPDSNYHMARETFLDQVPLPEANIYRIQGELPPAHAAELYEEDLKKFFSKVAGFDPGIGHPAFDLVFLGMGEDGHTASLFPDALGLDLQQRWTVPVEHNLPPLPLVDRVTLTPLLINAASNVVFLVSGASKAQRVAQVLEGSARPDLIPAQLIRPSHGELIWMLDVEAAGRLTKH